MSNIIKQEKYILADLTDNHNKYWHIIQYDDNSVDTQWGRIGDTGQSKKFPHYSSYDADRFFDSKCREKEKKGYVKQQVIDGSSGSASSRTVVANSQLEQIAKEQIGANSPETVKLIEWLARENVHTIMNATTLQ